MVSRGGERGEGVGWGFPGYNVITASLFMHTHRKTVLASPDAVKAVYKLVLVVVITKKSVILIDNKLGKSTQLISFPF